MEEYISVDSIDDVDNLKDPESGTIVFVKNINKYLIYNNDGWTPVEAKMTSEGLQFNLYDLNKQIIAQLPDFEESQWLGAEQVFKDWYKGSEAFYMLYGKEMGYFTVFQKKDDGEYTGLFDAIKDCLSSVGAVRGFDITEDRWAIEIWVYCATEDFITCLYLFPYSEGVVTYHE